MAVVDLATKGSVMESTLKNTKKHHRTSSDTLFRYAEQLNFGEVHIKFDPVTGLRAIVAIHSLKLGPAIGGCRIYHYDTVDDAMEDALRLGYMMSYKAAISNLPHGGAKAVIMKPKVIKDRVAFLRSFGDFVNDLGGRYVTAMDSGTSESDMDIIAERTSYVTCTSASGAGGDPSPTTAFGVRRGIESAVKFKLGRNDIEGIHVTVQGTGHVGYYLIKELHALGARMTVCDINPKSVQRCVDEFGVSVCSPDEIYDIEADVFAPCALGKILNLETINRLRVGIVAGSANNQLAHHKYGELLHERGILYAPDFVVNAGGLIYVAAVYDHADFGIAHQQVSDIYNTLTPIFERSIAENIATNRIAEQIAVAKLR
jgi:leucine dehydrogenase